LLQSPVRALLDQQGRRVRGWRRRRRGCAVPVSTAAAPPPESCCWITAGVPIRSQRCPVILATINATGGKAIQPSHLRLNIGGWCELVAADVAAYKCQTWPTITSVMSERLLRRHVWQNVQGVPGSRGHSMAQHAQFCTRWPHPQQVCPVRAPLKKRPSWSPTAKEMQLVSHLGPRQ
jgi:hypothetical protein